MTQAKRPFEVLSRNIGNSVRVKLKGSKVFTGKFLGYDPHWNISLAEAQECVDNQTTKLEKVILRGNNVLYVSSLDTS
jgi:small nuclear ribonucleoprotein (snRNP)-like protein